MAEGTSTAPTTSSTTTVEESDRELCAVCLEPYVHPARLPCGHVFCFLCIKGTANRSKRCAMCRQDIPHDFVEKPTLVDTIEEPSIEHQYQWYYEGRNGWWQYDERTSKELECAYKNGDRSTELLVAGFLYVMDFEAMLQLRRNDPSRRRRIKRDLANIDKIGIAGLHCPNLNKLNARTSYDNNITGSLHQQQISNVQQQQISSSSTEVIDLDAPENPADVTLDYDYADANDVSSITDSQSTIEYFPPEDLTMFINAGVINTDDT